MPKLGDIAKNERRRAERRVTSLRIKMYSAGREERKNIQSQIESIESLIKETRAYEGGKRIAGRTVESRRAAVEALHNINEQVELLGRNRNETQRRRNFVLQEKIRAVSRGEEVDDISESEMRSFFRATQEAWEGAPVEERYQRIMDYYGTNDLNLLWDIVMENNRNAIELLSVLESGESLTQEQRDFLMQLKANEDEQEKTYRNRENSPIKGKVASSIKRLTRGDVLEALGR